MPTQRLWASVAIVLVAAGCRDAAAPTLANSEFSWTSAAVPPPSLTGLHVLRQAAGAPPLETYQVSFWACDGEASTVSVNYQPVGGESVGKPFMRFDIPKNALATSPDGTHMKRGDSIFVTVTIDPVAFAVEFQPSGVWFSNGIPAQLTFWYENADPDLNGDGVVNAADQLLEQQIAVWGHTTDTPWVKLVSGNDTTLPSVSAFVRHFSEYAVSW